MATPSRSAQWVQLSTLTRRHVAYPPYHILPLPSPCRRGRRGLQLVSRSRLNTWEQRTCRWMARSDPAPALRLWLAHVSRPPRPPPPPAHGTVPRERCLCAARHRGAMPLPHQPGGHPHGVLPQLDGHRRGPRVGAVSPAARSSGPGGVRARAPRGPQLAVWRSCPTLAPPPPPPLQGWRAALSGRPRAGTPLGPRSPPHLPRRCRHPVGLGQRSPAPGAPDRWVGRRGGGLQGPLGGCHPRRQRPVPLPGRQVPRRALDPHAAAGAVLASIPRVYAVWYAVLPAPGSPQPSPHHQYPRAGDDATVRAWLAARALVHAWRQRRGVQGAFHAP